jgi:hypothetical protein
VTVSGGKTVKYRPGATVTFAAAGVITDGAFVEVTGAMTVGQAAAASTKIVGVALQAAVAVGDLIPVQLSGYVIVLKAKGAVAAGDPVGAASDGSAAVSTITIAAFGDVRKVAGIALEAISDGNTGRVYVSA